MTCHTVSAKSTQVVGQSGQLSFFLPLLCIQLVHLGLEPSLLLSELLILQPLLLKLKTCKPTSKQQGGRFFVKIERKRQKSVQCSDGRLHTQASPDNNWGQLKYHIPVEPYDKSV